MYRERACEVNETYHIDNDMFGHMTQDSKTNRLFIIGSHILSFVAYIVET